MSLQIQGVVGPPSAIPVGMAAVIRLGAGGDQIDSNLRGKYYEATRRGQIFNACTTAATTWTVGLATTYTGLMLYNPSPSVNLELLTCGMGLSTVQAAVRVWGLALGKITPALYKAMTITALASNSSLAGSGIAPQGVALTAATPLSPAPLYAETLGSFNYSTAVYATAATQTVDLAGRFVLQASTYVLVTLNGAGVGFSSLTWAEVPI